jgi:hypothetical protein
MLQRRAQDPAANGAAVSTQGRRQRRLPTSVPIGNFIHARPRSGFSAGKLPSLSRPNTAPSAALPSAISSRLAQGSGTLGDAKKFWSEYAAGSY